MDEQKASDGIHIYFLNLSFWGYKTMGGGRYKKDVTQGLKTENMDAYEF